MNATRNPAKSVGKAAIAGGLIFAGISAVGIVCFYLLQGADDAGLVFSALCVRMVIHAPAKLLLHSVGLDYIVHNREFFPFHITDWLDLAVNTLLGALAFGGVRLIWSTLYYRKQQVK